MFVIQALPIHKAEVWLKEREAAVQNHKDFVGVQSDHNLACLSAKTDRQMHTHMCPGFRSTIHLVPQSTALLCAH